MNLNQLRYFTVLAKLEHYTKAAEKLGISQPSLSHAIGALEEELGTELFKKQGRNVVLTKYGNFFLEYVEESLHLLDSGIAKTKELTGRTGGRIDLAFIYTMGSEFVPQLVGDFLRSYEELNVRFTFTVGNTSEIIEGLKEEKYDVAFCSMLEWENKVEFTPVAVEKMVVVVPKGHTLASKKWVDLAEAAAYPLVYYTRSSGLRPFIDHLFEMIRVKPKIAYEIEEDSSIAGLVAQNFGIAIMPKIPALDSIDVEVLELRMPEHKRQIYLAVSKENYQTPVVQKFVEYVKKHRRL